MPRISALEIEPEWKREQAEFLSGVDVTSHLVVDNLQLKFNLDQIRVMQAKIRNLPHEATASDIKTFMTEQYPENKAFSKVELDRDHDLTAQLHEPIKYSNIPKSAYAASMTASKAIFSDEAKVKKLQKVVDDVYHERNDKIFDVLKRLDVEGQKLEEAHESEVFSAGEQQRRIYLCFVEICRQIGRNSKSLACMAMKAFHEYFKITVLETKRVAGLLNRILDNYRGRLAELLDMLRVENERQRNHDNQIAEIKFAFDRINRVLEATQANLYIEESRAEGLRAKLDALKCSLQLVYPSCFMYLFDRQYDEVHE